MSGEEIRPTYKGFLKASSKAEAWGKKETERDQVQSQTCMLTNLRDYVTYCLLVFHDCYFRYMFVLWYTQLTSFSLASWVGWGHRMLTPQAL